MSSSSRRPDIIPGYPVATGEDIKLFQRNNGLKQDGIIGKKTRAAIWRKPKEKAAYTFLSRHPHVRGGAKADAAFFRQTMECMNLPLPLEAMMHIIRIVSSEWKTGLTSLYAQDGITVGPRRLAAGTLAKFCSRFITTLTPYLGKGGAWMMTLHTDQPNNGSPLDDPAMRLSWIEAMTSRDVWQCFVVEFVETVREVLREQPWLKTSWEIVLALRINNSGSGLVGRYVRKHGASYEGLKKGYSARGGRGPARIKRIEKTVPKEVWR